MSIDTRGQGTVTDLLSVTLRNRRRIILSGLALSVTAGAISLLTPRKWTSEASIQPQASRNESGLAGLAAQFGVNLPQSEVQQSPQFYVEVLRSHAILGAVVDSSYTWGRRQGTLIEFFRITSGAKARRRDTAIRKLREALSAAPGRQTGLVNIAVRTRDAQVSQAIATRLIEALNRLNLDRRQSRAGAERAFIERRRAEVLEELRQAEYRLQLFLQRNRDYRSSPMLTFQQDRLAREVNLHNQVFSTLSQSYETARLDEVRDTPVLAVIQPPTLPVRGDPRRTIMKVVLGLLLGLLGGLMASLLRERWQDGNALPPGEEMDLSQLLREAGKDFRRPWRLLRPQGAVRE